MINWFPSVFIILADAVSSKKRHLFFRGAANVSSKMTGGCYCGAVRYEIAHKPLAMFNCHCLSCQKVTGGAYTPVVLVASKSLTFTQGMPKYHFTENVAGGKHKRGFCADCGSRLTGAEGETPRDWVAVT